MVPEQRDEMPEHEEEDAALQELGQLSHDEYEHDFVLSHQYDEYTQAKHEEEEEEPLPEEQELDDVTLAQLDEEYATHPDEPQLEDEVQLREVWHQVE